MESVYDDLLNTVLAAPDEDGPRLAFADSPTLSSLVVMELRGNPIGPVGRQRLVARFGASVRL